MTAKLVFLCALTAILAGLVVLLIVLHPAQLPALAETIVGALLSALGLGAHAVFREPTPTPPASPANPTP